MTTPVNNNTNTNTNTNKTATNAQKQLAGNFDTFLKLLTTQLQNQDPTSPMDSNQFTQQLVMYSQVEQQIASNQNLEKLISLTQAQSNNLAMSYLGKNIVLSDGTGTLTSGAAQWTYGLDNDAAATILTVKDANGKVVYAAQVQPGDNNVNLKAGTHAFSWDGKTVQGDQLPDGLYTLIVSATSKEGKAVATSVASKAQVSGVDMSGSSPQLIIGNSEVPLSSATLVSN